MIHLNVGLMLFGLSLAFMLRAGIGLGPWDVFHQGLEIRTPLTIGQAMVLAGLVLLAFSATVARVPVGVGSLLNMLLIGPWVDLFLARPWFPLATGPLDGLALFALGLVMNGAATGLYITAGLGAGPRDGFALGLAKLARVPVGRARTAVEVVVCGTGWLLGGAVGVGTLLFAFSIGPLMQASLRILGGLDGTYARASAAARERRGPARASRPR